MVSKAQLKAQEGRSFNRMGGNVHLRRRNDGMLRQGRL
jgi:hypothetical protein